MSLIVDAAAAGHAASVFPQSVPHAGAMPAGVPAADAPRIEVPLELVRFRAASTAADLRRIAHLREEIALPAHVREAPAFARLEKKETSWALSAHSNAWER